MMQLYTTCLLEHIFDNVHIFFNLYRHLSNFSSAQTLINDKVLRNVKLEVHSSNSTSDNTQHFRQFVFY